MLSTRLAPSPTGALHLGNARTFLINHALAQRGGWRTVLRIEDLDSPRVKPGVVELTIDLLRWLGVTWEGPALLQSARRDEHERAMQTLAARGMVYPCNLTRKEIDAAASAPQEGSGEVLFPAHLRPNVTPRYFTDESASWRFVTSAENVTFRDEFAGEQSIAPSTTIGDFIVWTRRDMEKPGQAAYQLAVVVDDAAAGVTHVVRGDDLLDSAARQILIYRALGITPVPTYFHLPLVIGMDGKRLAKRHGDTRLDLYRSRGVTPQRVIGLVAFWCGVVPERTPLSLAEFVAGFDLTTIPKVPVTFTPDDHAFLMGT
jgi:glutamyl-tRNA synthetase